MTDAIRAAQAVLQADRKTCPQCGAQFTRGKGLSPSDWSVRKYCSVGCARKSQRRDSMLTLSERLMGKVVVGATPDDCWGWTGGLHTQGYGCISVSGKSMNAQRASWIVRRGPIPAGLYVLHRCDNRKCTNPRHLFLGTHLDNIADMVAKGRTVSPNAKLTKEQVLAIRNRLSTGVSQAALAREIGMSSGQMSRIATEKTWRLA